jgi:hypothetical protein
MARHADPHSRGIGFRGRVAVPGRAPFRRCPPPRRHELGRSDLDRTRAAEQGRRHRDLGRRGSGSDLALGRAASPVAGAAARAMLAACDPIRSEHGRLCFRSTATAAALAMAVRRAAEDEAAIGNRGFRIPALCADGAPCVLYVLPLIPGPRQWWLCSTARRPNRASSRRSRRAEPCSRLHRRWGLPSPPPRRILRTSSPRPAPAARPTSSG